MARTQIGTIIQELVNLEQTLTGADTAYVDTPESLGATPAWLNFPIRGELSAQTGWAEDRHTIGCACVKRRALLSRDEQLMRPLITQFPDLLCANLTLNGTVEFIDRITYTYGLIEALSSPDEPVFGILFEVEVVVKDTIDVGA